MPDEEKLTKLYEKAKDKLKDAREPVLVCAKIERRKAKAFAEKRGSHGFIFILDSPKTESPVSPEAKGSLYVFVDPEGFHERVIPAVVECITTYLAPWSFDALGSFCLVRPSAATRRDVGGGFREPDASLEVMPHRKPALTTVVEVAYSQEKSDLLDRMTVWVGPGGPAHVAIGVKIQYGRPPGEMPTVEVLLQLRGQSMPASVDCGADSECYSPGIFKTTLFIPVHELLYGTPWFLRLLVNMQLAVVVPMVSVVMGGPYALWDVLCGRRQLGDVVSACLRSLRGPWWGVVPLDAYWIRSAVKVSVLASSCLGKPRH